MEVIKNLLFSAAAVLAMLATSTLSIPMNELSYGYLPQYHVSAEVQQFLDELQQQNDMTNDPDSAALQQAQQVGLQPSDQVEPGGPRPEIPLEKGAIRKPIVFCYHSLYILAFTSGYTNAQSDDRAYVEMRLKSGETRKIRLYNRPGDDYMKYKGDLWKISLSSFGFNDKCITRYDIDNLALVEGGNDGWNIETVVTFLKRGSYYRLLSRDFNVYRWLDGNGRLSHLRFDLHLV